MTKTVKAWAVLVREENPRSTELRPVGNGKQFQYPVFFTRKEATEYKTENYFVDKVVPCTITYEAPIN
jgi:hypothetical protein